jgi:hypothetical protein
MITVISLKIQSMIQSDISFEYLVHIKLRPDLDYGGVTEDPVQDVHEAIGYRMGEALLFK